MWHLIYLDGDSYKVVQIKTAGIEKALRAGNRKMAILRGRKKVGACTLVSAIRIEK